MDLQPRQFTPASMPKQKVDHAASKPPAWESSGYRLPSHVKTQADKKGWSHEQVLQAANDPQTTYDNGRYPGQKRHIRGDLVAVVDPDRMHVVTVYQNVKETDLRPDQKDPDALAYGRRKG